MEIEFTCRVSIDREAWVQTYGCEPEAVAEDARSYMMGQLSESAAADEGAVTGVQMIDYRER